MYVLQATTLDDVPSNDFLKSLAEGPLKIVDSVPVYFVNGFKFHTTTYGSHRSTYNSGVCVKGSNYNEDSNDFYGYWMEF